MSCVSASWSPRCGTSFHSPLSPREAQLTPGGHSPALHQRKAWSEYSLRPIMQTTWVSVLYGFVCQLDTSWSYHRERSLP
ncbi:rCG33279 [Rattus norvegicus]|uniref:RCG33279 n=1 Tax=Rattus norvegicus TaxID=10116 RepID=A6HCP3_RAT|nr:rCG33279 [Rattus norvegicus]